MVPAPATTCAICDTPEADAALLQRCMECDRPYHLNPYRDREAPNCGDALAGTVESPALQFLCHDCLARWWRESGVPGSAPAAAGSGGAGAAQLPPQVAALLGIPPDAPVPPELVAMLQQMGAQLPGGDASPREAPPARGTTGSGGSPADVAAEEMGLSPEFALLQHLMSDRPPPRGSRIEDLDRAPDAAGAAGEAGA